MMDEEAVTEVTVTETSVRCSQISDDLVMKVNLGQVSLLLFFFYRRF